ncbi:phage tail protein [Helicobacter sp. UBA3407]|uniref:phage tail protein n=1 Tax=Helicobacter TaxID=209 RepID=UPI002614F82A|nr:phage tail protein [Helicobacter sp. UBA3407]
MAYLALGDFTFELKEAQLNTITENLSLPFSEVKRIGNHPAYFNSGKFEESLELELDFILQRQGILEEFKAQVKAKKPFFMVLGFGEIIGEVLVESFKIKRESLLPNGASLKRTLNLTLKRYYK